MMQQRLAEIRKNAISAFKSAKDANELEAAEVKFLGRKGELTGLLKDLADLSLEDKKRFGTEANKLKLELDGELSKARAELEKKQFSSLADSEWLDISAPGKSRSVGHTHLVTKAIREIENIFSRIGFVRERGNEIDWDWYSFESLNMPKDHPARDEWETFFLADKKGQIATDPKFGKMVLTPHTSNAQVRALQRGEFPIRMICVGKCFRRQIDVSHAPMFHQFEGFYVDKHVTIKHLKGVLDYFAKSFFGPDRKLRLRPFHFRFTEPSFEIDVSCGVCGGTGLVDGRKCGICKRGWLELGGAGMTHPNVLRAGGIDPEKYGAFAFGWGVERTYMMKEGLAIPDIRWLYKNDLRFLKQL